MTYEEIKNKLSICEKALNSIKTGGYKNQTKKNTQLKIQELRTLKEGLEKKLNEQEGVVQTDDESKAEKLAKKGINVKLTEQDKGVQFGQNETAAIATEVGKATAKALLAVGEELASMKGIRIRPNSFDIKAVFKGEKGEEEFSFYIEDDTLHLNDMSFDKEIADVGVMPSGKPLVNVDVIANELQKHFRSLNEITESTQEESVAKLIQDHYRNPNTGVSMISDRIVSEYFRTHKDWDQDGKWDGTEEGNERGMDDFNEFFGANYGYMFPSAGDLNERESYDANDDLNSMDFSKLNSGQKAAFDVWIVQYAEGYFDNKAELQGMIDKFAEVENAYDLEDFVHADFAGDKGERQIFIRQLIKAYLDDDQPLDEGKGDDHHYIKVPRREYNSALHILDGNIDGNSVKMDIVDKDGAGNVIFYFTFRSDDIITGQADSFMYDAVNDLQAHGIEVVDSSVSDIDEDFDPRGIDQEEAMDLRIRLKDLEEEREDILRNMEQEAEPEGGPIADDYGSILNDIDEKIYKIKKQIDQYDMNESPMTMAYTKIVKPKKTNEESVARIQKAYDVLIDNMKELGKKYNAGDKSLIGQLKKLTKQKKYLEKTLQDKVANIGKNQKLDELSVDKEDALDELRDILGRVNDLGDQAREIIKQEFPSYLSKGDSYGVFNMGSSYNRYDTTLESMIDGIEKYYDEEEDELDEADLDKGEKKKLKDMSKSLKKSSKGHAGQAKYIDKLVKEGRGDLDMITRIIDDRANESGFSTQYEAEEVIEAIADHYKLNLKEEKKDIEKEKKDYDKEIEHDCANHVLHEKYGHGLCLEGQHTLLEDGTVTHYDVFFKEGSKRVKNIPLNELKVITSSNHGHKRRKK